MNNKDFISALAIKAGVPVRDAQTYLADLADCIATALDEQNTVVIPGFGNFEVKKKLERVVVNPTTQQRMLVPPKLVVNFRSSSNLKDRMQ